MALGISRWHNRDSRLAGFLVLFGAAVIALVSARDYVGGWNDGSRLATVECLVDQHTLAIDRSVFAGTGDKLFIRGHYYSDKSPVPALLLAGVYQGWQWCTGLTVRERPDLFCWWMTVASSGLAYLVAVWSLFQLGNPLGLPGRLRLGLTASLALATVALPYARHVNNHILFLGVSAALMLNLAGFAVESRVGKMQRGRLLGLGTLAGLGYTIDLGTGPVLLACLFPAVWWRCRRWSALGIMALAMLPWLVLHHAVNYSVGGTLKPANAVVEYFAWPGCSFNPQNMTGTLNHSLGHFLIYAAALLGGKRGFLGHNLPLFLALPGIVVLFGRRVRETPELLFAAAWCGGTWLAYALTSNNYSGICCSIRWFVPLLAPGYYVLAILLRDYPTYRLDFLVLSGWGAVAGGLMWWQGPWMEHMLPFFWPLQAAALLSWAVCRAWQRRREGANSAIAAREPERLPEAA